MKIAGLVLALCSAAHGASGAPAANAPRLPTIRWGQDSDTIYLRLQVKCASAREVDIKPLRLTHRCKGETGVLYETDIPLRAPIVPSASSCKPVGVNDHCVLSKFVPHALDRLSSVQPDENAEFHAALRRDFDRWLESVPPRGTDIVDPSEGKGQKASTKINPRDEDEDADEKADALEQRTGGDGRELVRTVPESGYRRDANTSAPELPAGRVTLQSAAGLFGGDDGVDLVVLDVQYAWCRRCDSQARTVAAAARINNGTKPYAFGWVDATHEPDWAHALGLECGGGTHTAASTGVDKSAPPTWSQGDEGEHHGAGRPMCGLYVFAKAPAAGGVAGGANAGGDDDDADAILARAGLRLVSKLAVLRSNRIGNSYDGEGPHLILRQLEALSGPAVLTLRTAGELEALHKRAASNHQAVALAWLPAGAADDTTIRARSAFRRVAEQVVTAGRTIFAEVPLSFATDNTLPADLAPPPTIERASRRMQALLHHGRMMRLRNGRYLLTNESQAQANATHGELEAAVVEAGVNDDNSIVDAGGVAHPYVSVHAEERYFNMEGHKYAGQYGGADVSKNVSTWAAGARFERLAGTSCGAGGKALGADEAAYALLRFVVVDGTPLLSPLNVLGKALDRFDQGRHGAWIAHQDGRQDPADAFLPPWPYYAEALDRLINWRPKAAGAALTCAGVSQVRELGGSHSAGVRGFLHAYDRADAWDEYMNTQSTIVQMENFRITAAGMKGRMPMYILRKSCSAEVEKIRRLQMSDITFPSASAVTTFAEPQDQSEGAEEPMAWVVPQQVIRDDFEHDGNRALIKFYDAIAAADETVAKPFFNQICLPGQTELPPGQGMMDVKYWVPGEIRPMGAHSIDDDLDWISGAMGVERTWRAGDACPDVDAATAADRADAADAADSGAVVITMYNSTEDNNMRDLRTHYTQKLLAGVARAFRDLAPFPHNFSALANGMRPTANATDEELNLAKAYSATAKAGLVVAEYDVRWNHYTPGLFFKPEDEGGKRVENKPWPAGYVKPLSDKAKRERVDLIDMAPDDMLKNKRSQTSFSLKAARRQRENLWNLPQIFVGDARLLRRLQRRRKLKACGADLLQLEALYKASKGKQGLKPVKRFSKYIGPIKQSNVLKWLKKKSPFVAKRWAELKRTLKVIKTETALEANLTNPVNQTFFSKDRPLDSEVDITPEKGWASGTGLGLPTPGGVLKRVVKKGKPSSIYGRVAVGDGVKAHYHGYRTNGSIFDSSIAFRRPYDFVIGAASVIGCWDVAFLSMEIGERAIITCRPDYAYGDTGVGNGKIVPCETLQFDVTLLNITSRLDPRDGPRNYTLGDPGYNETNYPNATCVEENEALRVRGEDPNVGKWPGYVVKPGLGLVLADEEDKAKQEDQDQDESKSKSDADEENSAENDSGKGGDGEKKEKGAVGRPQGSTSDNELSAAIESQVAARDEQRTAQLEKALRKAKALLKAKIALGKPDTQIAAARARVRAAAEALEKVERDGTESEQKRKALADAVAESGDS